MGTVDASAAVAGGGSSRPVSPKLSKRSKRGSMSRLPSLLFGRVATAASQAVCSVLRRAHIIPNRSVVEEEEEVGDPTRSKATPTPEASASSTATAAIPAPASGPLPLSLSSPSSSSSGYNHLHDSATLIPNAATAATTATTTTTTVDISALPEWQPDNGAMEIQSLSPPATAVVSVTPRPAPNMNISLLTQTLGRLSTTTSGVPPSKENRTPMLSVATPAIPVPMLAKELPSDPAALAERLQNQRFTEEALDMARLALKTNETPVGCVLVHKGKVIARGMNATNVSRNGTRHAEYMAIGALLSSPPASVLKAPTTDAATDPAPTTINPKPRGSETRSNFPDSPSPAFADDHPDVRLGHLYPYGQKLLPLRAKVPRSILRECTLYVTVEPCVMCASMLRQLGIKKVYFGAVNDKFGGTGGVFSIHANSPPIPPGTNSYDTALPSRVAGKSPDVVMAAPGIPLWRPMAPGEGDGGNVEPGYQVEGGWGRDEAVGLLRRFYVQENGRAPVPRKKEGRAARLAAIMAQDLDAPLPPELAVHVSAMANAASPGSEAAGGPEVPEAAMLDSGSQASNITLPASVV